MDYVKLYNTIRITIIGVSRRNGENSIYLFFLSFCFISKKINGDKEKDYQKRN